jgi:hypothetical protein
MAVKSMEIRNHRLSRNDNVNVINCPEVLNKPPSSTMRLLCREDGVLVFDAGTLQQKS